MANDAAKKRLAENTTLRKKHTQFILGFNVRRGAALSLRAAAALKHGSLSL